MKKLTVLALGITALLFSLGAVADCEQSGYITRITNYGYPTGSVNEPPSDALIYFRKSGGETNGQVLWYGQTYDVGIAAAANAVLASGPTKVTIRGNIGTLGGLNCPTTGNFRYIGEISRLWVNP